MPFKIVRNDITKMQVDVIVNTANQSPTYSTGVDAAVYKAAGREELLAARKKIGFLDEGEAVITPGFQLPAKYIIHAISPLYIDGSYGEAELLRACYEKSLRLAVEYQCKSIAFPLIATGNFGYPKDEGMEIALDVIHRFLMKEVMKEEMMVYLVVFDTESVRLSGRLYDEIEAFIDQSEVDELQEIEYDDMCGEESDETWMLTSHLSEACSVQSLQPNDLEKPAAWSAQLPQSNALEKAAERSSQLPQSNAPKGLAKRFVQLLQSNIQERREAEIVPMTSAQSVDKSDFLQENVQEPVIKKLEGSKRSLEDIMSNAGETFQQRLFRLIDERGKTDVEVYKGAGKDKKLFHKIRCNVNYQPTKHTVFAFALSLELSLDDTKDLLASAGFAFSPSNRFDRLMMYVFEHEIYNIHVVDSYIFDFDMTQFFACEK